MAADATDDVLGPVREWFAPTGRGGGAPERAGPVEAVLSTIDAAGGGAAAHWVRARRLDHGIVLCVRRDSAVGVDLAVTPEAVVCIRAPAGSTTARIPCVATRLDDVESDQLFDDLDRAAQLRAWPGTNARERFAGQLVPRPRGWVGMRLLPDAVHVATGPAD